jgi:membrane-associated tyrosine/threonine-specific cdc2-inhibitory kinase
MISDVLQKQVIQDFNGVMEFTKRTKKCSNAVKNPLSLSNKRVYEFEKKFSKDFEVISFIGKGSFGDVLKVRWKADGNLYAVKWSKKKYRGNLDRKSSILELYAFSSVGAHPYLIDFVQAWASRGFMLVQIELCELGTLENKLCFESLEESEIWEILLDVTLATKWLHDQQFLHLDIKPDNIFISNQGFYKLGDFGLSQFISSDGNKGEGDSRYLAPEVLGSEQNSTASDVFSIGASVFEASEYVLLPSYGDSWNEFRKNPPPLKNRSDELNQVVLKFVPIFVLLLFVYLFNCKLLFTT